MAIPLRTACSVRLMRDAAEHSPRKSTVVPTIDDQPEPRRNAELMRRLMTVRAMTQMSAVLRIPPFLHPLNRAFFGCSMCMVSYGLSFMVASRAASRGSGFPGAELPF